MIKNVKEFLNKAVLITCLVSTIAQAVPAPQSAEMPINPEAAASMTVDMTTSSKEAMVFQSKTFDGETMAFVMDSDAAAKHVGEGMEGLPYAAKVISTEGASACVVSVDTPIIYKLDQGAIHYGTNESGGMITDQSVASSFTTYHEMGHCLDFVSSQEVIQNMVGAGVGALSLPGAAITQAMEKGNDHLDFSALGNMGAGELSQIAQQTTENGNFEVGVSLMEVYADLHGTLHVASTTGDFRGFSDFGMGFRLGQDSKMTHSTGLAVAKIFEREISSGFDISKMQGLDNKQITQVVNDIFARNFYEDGHLSMKSEGFKDIIKDMQIKQSIGREAPDALDANLKSLSSQLDAKPSDADKALFVEMMGKNLDFQKSLMAKDAGAPGAAAAHDLLNAKTADFEQAKQALGVSSGNRADAFFTKNTDISSRDVRTAWRGYLNDAVTKQQGELEVNIGSIADYMTQPIKTVESELSR